MKKVLASIQDGTFAGNSIGIQVGRPCSVHVSRTGASHRKSRAGSAGDDAWLKKLNKSVVWETGTIYGGRVSTALFSV